MNLNASEKKIMEKAFENMTEGRDLTRSLSLDFVDRWTNNVFGLLYDIDEETRKVCEYTQE